ncbi:hypothetical protein OCU04_012529 [Sclerotinia nivalis]|uniref:DUF7707 domain-containing protein n=1 Tax=Sclerotinia nivalis TaxID=352851 RepID=A0A9X0DE85_9HELO|nr:hypothetical protein OCU04_012529 [Sclerotinia nivalis]
MFIKSIVGLSIVALVAAQSSSSNATIDPSTVDASTRAQWCTAQINTCGTLCNGAINDNTCDTINLNFSCTCTSNSSAPGLQYYTQTLPTYICEQVYANCIAAGENDAAAQRLCTQNEVSNCGHLNPDDYTPAAASSSSSSASATATSTSTTTATTASASAAASTGAASALNIGREYGTGILAAGIAGVFGLIL